MRTERVWSWRIELAMPGPGAVINPRPEWGGVIVELGAFFDAVTDEFFFTPRTGF